MNRIIKIYKVFLFVSFVSYSQINEELKAELDEIYYYDQELRKLFDNKLSRETKEEILLNLNISKEEFEQENWNLVEKQDSLNLIKVSKIIDIYGYPGKTLVGEKTNVIVWSVVQHSNSIEKYFPLIKDAGEKGELAMNLVAMMEDRMLMNQGKEQVYGTQIKGEKINNEHIFFVWPIKDTGNVNERRKNIGFEETIEEYAKYFDIEYKIYTLEDVFNMRDNSKNK